MAAKKIAAIQVIGSRGEAAQCVLALNSPPEEILNIMTQSIGKEMKHLTTITPDDVLGPIVHEIDAQDDHEPMVRSGDKNCLAVFAAFANGWNAYAQSQIINGDALLDAHKLLQEWKGAGGNLTVVQNGSLSEVPIDFLKKYTGDQAPQDARSVGTNRLASDRMTTSDFRHVLMTAFRDGWNASAKARLEEPSRG
jgi:hypothetical protein